MIRQHSPWLVLDYLLGENGWSWSGTMLKEPDYADEIAGLMQFIHEKALKILPEKLEKFLGIRATFDGERILLFSGSLRAGHAGIWLNNFPRFPDSRFLQRKFGYPVSAWIVRPENSGLDLSAATKAGLYAPPRYVAWNVEAEGNWRAFYDRLTREYWTTSEAGNSQKQRNLSEVEAEKRAKKALGPGKISRRELDHW
ncbi:MAG: hypothetical protein AB1405_06525 [Bdellovibrionota bacterium]